jgi:hypothetical protein
VVAVEAEVASRDRGSLRGLRLASYFQPARGRQCALASELPLPTHEHYQYQENICGQLSTGSTASTSATL